MAYKKKDRSDKTQTTILRLDAMKTIDTQQKKTIDYGNANTGPLTVAVIEAKIATYDDTIATYNQTLQTADTLKSTLKKQEKELAGAGATVLKAAGVLFGEDSNEVVLLGGKKKSDHKRPVRKTKKAP